MSNLKLLTNEPQTRVQPPHNYSATEVRKSLKLLTNESQTRVQPPHNYSATEVGKSLKLLTNEPQTRVQPPHNYSATEVGKLAVGVKKTRFGFNRTNLTNYAARYGIQPTAGKATLFNLHNFQSNAYIIAGHGEELQTSFIVPKGCTIVVDMHIGKLQHEDRLGANYNKLCNIDIDKLKDPVTYSSELLSEFKSLAIYKEGEECPQFSYQLVGCHPSIAMCDELNGIIDIDTFKSLGHCGIHRTDYSKFHYSIDDVSRLYEYSTYPTMDQVKKVLLDSIDSNDSSKSFLNTIFKHKLTNVTQEELCKKFPGVYYNFICRETDLTNELYKYNRNLDMNIMHNIGPILQLRPNIRNTIGKKISEAERHRKPYIKKAYNSMKKGGGPLPLRFFDVNAEHPSADAGNDLLSASGRLVRPAIGGKHSGKHTKRSKHSKRSKRTKRNKRSKRTMKGGFFPSIMEPFVLGCSKYIAPLAGLSAYKLLHNPTKKSSRARK